MVDVLRWHDLFPAELSPQNSRVSRRPVFEWTGERDAELMLRYNAGASLAEIAKHFGTADKTVSRRVEVLIRFGELNPREPLSDNECRLVQAIPKILELYKTGANIGEISKLVGGITDSQIALVVYILRISGVIEARNRISTEINSAESVLAKIIKEGE